MNQSALMFFVGATVGFWGSLFAFSNFLEWRDKKAAKTGFIKIDDEVYRIQKLQDAEL